MGQLIAARPRVTNLYHSVTDLFNTQFQPRLTNNLQRVFATEKSIGTLFYPMTAAGCVLNAPDGPPPSELAEVCVADSSHALFKAQSSQSDTLHLNMSIWLAVSSPLPQRMEFSFLPHQEVGSRAQTLRIYKLFYHRYVKIQQCE